VSKRFANPSHCFASNKPSKREAWSKSSLGIVTPLVRT
jgi:hypothetical protein